MGHKPLWEDITDDNLRDLFEKIKENYAPNSAKTVCATIKTVIRENDATKVINSPTFGKTEIDSNTLKFFGVYDEDLDNGLGKD